MNIVLRDEFHILVVKQDPARPDLDHRNVVALVRACTDMDDNAEELVRTVGVHSIVAHVKETQVEREHHPACVFHILRESDRRTAWLLSSHRKRFRCRARILGACLILMRFSASCSPLQVSQWN